MSPFHEAEEALVLNCIQMDTIHQPLTVWAGITMINNFNLTREIEEFQGTRKWGIMILFLALFKEVGGMDSCRGMNIVL